VIGTLAVDRWAVTFGTARTGLGVSSITARTSMASVSTPYYLMYHYNCLWSLKG